MIRRRGIVILTLALALACGIAFASEEVKDGAPVAHQIMLVDGELISPSALTMSRDDVLEFENYSGHAMLLVFVEPRDQADKIRCRMSGAEVADPSRARWLRFGWSLGQRLTATIPPGRFASVCSLAPGQYAFVARQVSGYLPRPDAALGTKATITVQ